MVFFLYHYYYNFFYLRHWIILSALAKLVLELVSLLVTIFSVYSFATKGVQALDVQSLIDVLLPFCKLLCVMCTSAE